ncbi:MAG: Chemotaxis regulator - transmits chemoreceptor signals to flagellar motor components CheY [uncultured Caballeronia sp.]|nr:MAG: Chemotaxis regulator - transmits chemoreceptor signals to flagellar motor components CheY [uncultured Caballeronia sp.]
MLTTESGEPFKAAARAVGATGWIEKPFDPDVLTDLVARLSEAEHPHLKQTGFCMKHDTSDIKHQARRTR